MVANQSEERVKRKREDGGTRKLDREAKPKRRKVAGEGEENIRQEVLGNKPDKPILVDEPTAEESLRVGIKIAEGGRGGNVSTQRERTSDDRDTPQQPAAKDMDVRGTGVVGPQTAETERAEISEGQRTGRGRKEKRKEKKGVVESQKDRSQQPLSVANGLLSTVAEKEHAPSPELAESSQHETNEGRHGEEKPKRENQLKKDEGRKKPQRPTNAPNESHAAARPVEKPVNGLPKVDGERKDAVHNRNSVVPLDKAEYQAGDEQNKLKQLATTQVHSNATDEASGEIGDTLNKSMLGRHSGKARKERRAEKTHEQGDKPLQQGKKSTPDGQTHGTANLSKGSASESKRERRHRHRDNNRAEKETGTLAWKLSDPVGGRFISIEPLFSVDERYLFIVKARVVQVYSTKTSLLVRSLPMDRSGHITACALSTVNPHYLYIATLAGNILRWNWVDGEKAGRWNISSPIYSLATSAREGGTEDTVYTVDKNKRWTITGHRLRSGFEASKTEVHTLYKSAGPVQSMKVLSEGDVIVAISEDKLIIGHMSKPGNESLKDLQYIWREIKCTDRITCFDARLSRPSGFATSSKKVKAKGGAVHLNVNIILGCLGGEIYVYEDFLNKLASSDQTPGVQNRPVNLIPRKLHWHREAVNTAKWSLDGNYIISGGRETTMVIWQLDTGKKQFLPYLTSVIESLVVSPTGSSYALRLADNSVMILSTTELKPTANIAGIQSTNTELPTTSQTAPQPAGSGDAKRHALGSTAHIRIPTTISRLRPNQVLLAVPASQPSFDSLIGESSFPFLQTFDISSASHISRQALARTNTTFPNIGGDGSKLHEPSITFLQTSKDGRWLATVDEWSPTSNEIDPSAGTASFESGTRPEIYLRFWSWAADRKEWTLETRIDAPHELPNGPYAGRVLDLVSDPSSNGFATIGEDSVVRVWTPKKRLRYGSLLRNDNGEPLVAWSCRHAIELDWPAPAPNAKDPDLSTRAVPVNGHLAFSLDGSVLAANLQYRQQSLLTPIHFISPTTGTIQRTHTDYAYAPIVAMAFLFRHLIILTTSALTVWDVVTDTLSYGFALRLPAAPATQLQNLALLATNQTANTFAVALPVLDANYRKSNSASATQDLDLTRYTSSKVIVWDPAKPAPLYACDVPHLVSALLPARGEGAKGYVILDSAAEVRTLNPRGAVGIPLLSGVGGTNKEEEEDKDTEALNGTTEAQPEDDNNDTAMIDDVPSLKAENATQDEGRADLNLELEDDTTDKPVVRPEQLAEIFEAGGLSNVRDIFEAVVGLYGRRPRVVGVVADADVGT